MLLKDKNSIILTGIILVSTNCIFLSCKNTNNEACKTDLIDSLIRVSNEQYSSEPRKSLINKQKLDKLYACSGAEDKKVGFLYLNIASIYGEKLNEPDSALLYLDRALKFHYHRNDTMNRANILKYQALFLADIGQYNRAVDVVEKSIALYNLINYNQGLHVAYQNLAVIQLEKGNFITSDSLLHICMNYWESVNNTQRQKFVFEDYVKLCELNINCACIDKIESLSKEFAFLKAELPNLHYS